MIYLLHLNFYYKIYHVIILREIHFLNLYLLYNQNLEENFFSMSESYFIPSQFIK